MWPKLVAIVLCGFLVFGRSFAYVGIPQAKLFVGEILLGAFAFARPRDLIGRWLQAIMRPSWLNGPSIALLLFLSYGLFQVARGVANEYSPFTVFQSAVFHFYPLYIFLGVWVGTRRPDLLMRTIPVLAWMHGLWGILYATVFSGVWLPIPGTNTNLIGQPNGAVIAILGLISLPRLRRSDAFALMLNIVVLLALQVRADWLATIVAVLIWGVARVKIGHIALAATCGAALFFLAWAFNIRVPGPADRGGDVTAEKAAARVIAPFDVNMARDLDSSADIYKGTTTWRTKWWEAIWAKVHSNPNTTFLGNGYGYPLANLVPYLRMEEIRSPHNVFFYALGYGGWFGVILFFSLQAQLMLLEWRVFRLTGDILGLLVIVQAVTAALFGNLFETPFGAIPIYLLVGMTAAPLLRQEQVRFESSYLTQLLPATRW